MSIHFGFLSEPLSFEWRGGRIAKVDDWTNLVAKFSDSHGVYKGWIYPPLKAVDCQGAAAKEAWVPATFAVPSTHTLTLSPKTDPRHADFFIVLLGLLTGRRLQRQGWQHFYKAPIDRKLCDFVPSKSAICWAMDKATDFCERHCNQPEVLKLAFGAIHWHTFAQLYEHEFERFDAQYKALDACYKLTLLTQRKFKEASHAKRAHRLCEHFGVEPPEWVIPVKNAEGKETCELATRRNALAHEALYGNEPVGFAYPGDHGAMDLGLKALVARVLLSVLGMKNEYTRSSSTTRQMHSFDRVQTSAPTEI